MNQLAGCKAAGADEASVPLLPALLCTLGSVTVPAAAAVYNEAALKKHMDTSVHLQNFFLYFFGACFNGLSLLVNSAWQGTSLLNVFHGLSAVTLVLIVNNAAQGILSSFFFKFADTILKKYSSTIATLFTAVMSWAAFGHQLTLNFLVGLSIVFVSMHQFFTFGDVKKGGGSVSGGGAGGGGGGGDDKGSLKKSLIYSPSLDHVQSAAVGGAGRAVNVGPNGALLGDSLAGGMIHARGTPDGKRLDDAAGKLMV